MKRALGISLWFIFLALPLLAVRVNTLDGAVEWRWANLCWLGGGVLVLTLSWQTLTNWRERFRTSRCLPGQEGFAGSAALQTLLDNRALCRRLLSLVTLAALVFPWLVSTPQNFYHVNVMVGALIFVVLALGLNITVGLAGLLDLGYIAFFAVGAYSYALLNKAFGLGFWSCLPLGGLTGMLFGLLLGFPILRLRGDYLAIVTLGFGSITKIVLENWDALSGGAAGIAGIPRPELFALSLDGRGKAVYSYYIVLALVVLTIFVTLRLKHSRIGRAWLALREDEIACVAMGVDMAGTKLSAYALGAFWAGLVGVVFAAHNNFINPDSFTFMESAMILAMVVLGGMGSLLGVIVAALTLKLLPEYLRAFAEYRMLIFGAVMVLMMIFRPHGLVSNVRRRYAAGEGDDAGR